MRGGRACASRAAARPLPEGKDRAAVSEAGQDETAHWPRSARRGPDEQPADEAADFEDTIFDDHDIRDDWNTSYAWRREMWSQPWWKDRITGGIGSYWIYQHLGNMSPQDRASDPLLAKLREASDTTGDAGAVLDEFAERADKEPASTRWSYAHDWGGTRLIVVDSRCSRLLTADRRGMLDDEEFDWLDGQCQGGMDHLLIASSLPYLLPMAIHHAESWNEAVAGGAWGKRGAGVGEKIRQAADLEHWAAFERSFRDVAADVIAVGRGERGPAPASISFLSGDIHYSYLARVTEPLPAAGEAREGARPADPVADDRGPLVPQRHRDRRAVRARLQRALGESARRRPPQRDGPREHHLSPRRDGPRPGKRKSRPKCMTVSGQATTMRETRKGFE